MELMKVEYCGFLQYLNVDPKKTSSVIGIVSSDVDLGLVSFHVQLVNEYLDLPSTVYRLSPNAGSDQYATPVLFWTPYIEV
jgi:hypothetical protein